jgi:hypothetical protein
MIELTRCPSKQDICRILNFTSQFRLASTEKMPSTRNQNDRHRIAEDGRDRKIAWAISLPSTANMIP